jgi:addiction module HigA family antidote
MVTMTVREPSTPGEILQEEFLEPVGLTQGQLADFIGVERRRINEIISGKRDITPDTAIRLGKFFSVSPQFWMNLQVRYNLWYAQAERKKEYNKIKPRKAG